jgi:hypothetical protein
VVNGLSPRLRIRPDHYLTDGFEPVDSKSSFLLLRHTGACRNPGDPFDLNEADLDAGMRRYDKPSEFRIACACTLTFDTRAGQTADERRIRITL